jgi:hypothetical protein
MIRPETYYKIANEFGTGVGIAEVTGPVNGVYPNIKSIPDEVRVNILTNFVIREEVYQQVIREVLRLEKKYKNKRINKSTMYEKAINTIKENQLV